MANPEKRPSVLVAEDDPSIRKLLEAILEACGCSAVFANDGEEALSHWRSRDFDVILMDIRMPYVNGCTAAQQIRHEERTEGRKRVPVIAITAVHDDLDACELDEILRKPFKTQEVCNVVNQYSGAPQRESPSSNF